MTYGCRIIFPSRCARSRRSPRIDRKSTRLNSSHGYISYAVFCLTKKQAAYDERRLSGGELERDRLLVLADALEEAGAAVELIDHQRSAGAHDPGFCVGECLIGP